MALSPHGANPQGESAPSQMEIIMITQPIRVVIQLEDGIIQKVVASAPVIYLVHDLDVEGNSPEEIVNRPNLNGTGLISVFRSTIEESDVSPDLVAWVFDTVVAEAPRIAVAPEAPITSTVLQTCSLSDWREEVGFGNTVLGYADWCAHQAEAEKILPTTTRCIFSEALKANFVRIGEDETLHDIAISRAVIGQVILEQIGPGETISESLFNSRPEVGESFCWLMSSFELANWRGNTIANFLRLWGFQDSSDQRNALGLPQSEANTDGVHQRFVSVEELRHATPVGNNDWTLPDGTVIGLFERSADAVCM